jgi:hypothetical protein
MNRLIEGSPAISSLNFERDKSECGELFFRKQVLREHALTASGLSSPSLWKSTPISGHFHSLNDKT